MPSRQFSRITAAVCIFLCAVLFATASASAQSPQSVIESFEAVVKIDSDASIRVLERIVYDFGNAEKHGIFREIPVELKTAGGYYASRITNISVTDEKGKPYPFARSNSGLSVQLKIGDPHATVSGKKIYIIQYQIARILNYAALYTELYWNVTGHDWTVPVKRADVRIVLPEAVTTDDIKASCIAGPISSNRKCGQIYGIGTSSVEIILAGHENLLPREALIANVQFPRGLVQEPAFLKLLLISAVRNWLAIAFALAVGIVVIWRFVPYLPRRLGAYFGIKNEDDIDAGVPPAS